LIFSGKKEISLQEFKRKYIRISNVRIKDKIPQEYNNYLEVKIISLVYHQALEWYIKELTIESDLKLKNNFKSQAPCLNPITITKSQDPFTSLGTSFKTLHQYARNYSINNMNSC
jgi:hypothetical protein